MNYAGIVIIFSIWAIGVICISIILHAYLPEKIDPQENSRNDSRAPAENSEYKSNNKIFTAVMFHLVCKYKTYRNKHNSEEEAKSFREWIAIGIGIFTFVVLTITCVAIINQVEEMRKAYEPMSEQARYTREAYIAIQRPYIVVGDDPIITPIPDPKLPQPMGWGIRSVAVNKGQTPANIRSITLLGEANKDCPALFSMYAPKDPELYYRRESPDQIVRIFPSKSVPLGTGNRANNRGDGLPILNGSADWDAEGYSIHFLFGSIHYTDMFDGTPEHITKFCYVLKGTKSGGNLTVKSDGLCPYWNCSDEECKYDQDRFQKQIKTIVDSLPAEKRFCPY